MNKALLSTTIITGMAFTAVAQNVNIPDANFKAILVADASINTNQDQEIQMSEAAAYSDYLDVSASDIADLTGIEAFTALEQINCGSNTMTSLDFSQNTALTDIESFANLNLDTINLTQNASLQTLDIRSCTTLTNINVTQNTGLTELYANGTPISKLDVSNNLSLERLQLASNDLASLDVTQNTELDYLYVRDSPLTMLDVSQNTLLGVLDITNSSIQSLDISQNTALTVLEAMGNDLIYLNAANGENASIVRFVTTFNLNLDCIQVDDPTYSEANWRSTVDSTSSFSTECAVGIDENTVSNDILIYPNPVTSILNIDGGAEIQNVQILNAAGQYVLSTIESRISIEYLEAGFYTLIITTAEGLAYKGIVKR